MIRKVENRFSEETEEKTEIVFRDYLGDSNSWLVDFLYALKREWINNNFKISDIMIRANKKILVAPIKNYIMFQADEFASDFVPSTESIVDIAKKFTTKDIDVGNGEIVEFSFFVFGLGIFRVSFSSDELGVGLAIRYLTFSLPTLQTRDYPQFYENFIKSMVSENVIATPKGNFSAGVVKSGGLILHIGATGTGKTTGIASEVGYFAEETTGAIVTYENPIEYRYIGTTAPVRQYELGVDIKKSKENSEFGEMKRHLLRNNPSLVVIGEARTNEEIREMLDTSARGHLVLGTIHSTTVIGALTILMSITKDEPHLLANNLHAIVAHKLFTNKRGELVPIYEILIPDVTIKNFMQKGDISGIAKIMIQEKTAKNAISFSDSFNNAVKTDKLTVKEVNDIQNGIYGS